MKRCVLICLCLLCLFSITISAEADVIVLPENAFFQRQDKVFQREDRQYTPNGEVAVYESPEDSTVVDTVSEQIQITISYTYTDEQGNVWGLYDEYGMGIGWIPMENLSLVYDMIAFAEDYADQIRNANGMLSNVYFGEYARFHSYPGSAKYVLCKVSDWNHGYGPHTYSKMYLDEAGHTWVMVDKYHSIDDIAWVDVTADPPEPPATEVTIPDESEIHQQMTEMIRHVQTLQNQDEKDPLLKVALVLWIGVLIMVTGLLIWLLKRKK